MPAKPLPESRVVLEQLFDTCSKSLRLIESAAQRDLRRAQLMSRRSDGDISREVYERHEMTLAESLEDSRDQYVPDVNILWPYCDQEDVAKARFLLEFGRDATREGIARSLQNELFSSMIAAGFAMAARGQWMHVHILSEMQGELTSALEQLDTEIPRKPNWDPATGRLTFRGKIIRQVRGISVARRLRPILDAFEEAEWPAQIKAPASYSQQELHDAIRGLNQNLELIRFRSDGTGKGVVWEMRD